MATDNNAVKNAVKKIEEEVDNNLVEKAFVKIQEIYIKHHQGYLLEVANYLAETFFNGDEELIRKRKPAVGKVKSFNALCDKLNKADANLPKKSWLYSAVNVFQDNKYLEQLGNDELFQTYGKLSPSAKVELTRIKDKKKKVKLIEEAAKKKLSVRMLRNRVSKLNSTSQKKKIKIIGDFGPFINELKTIHGLLKIRRAQVKRAITKGDEVEEFKSLEKKLDDFMKQLEEMGN